jgi:hypothetical protein
MSGGRWFRLYDSLLNDPKVQRLPPKLFKGLINLWCYASQHNGIVTEDEKELSFVLRTTTKRAKEIQFSLFALGFFDKTPDGLTPHNWQERQRPSDNYAANKRAYREKSQDKSKDCPPLEERREEKKEIVGAEAQAKRRRQLPEDWKPPSVEGFSFFEIDREVPQFRDYHAAKGSVMKDWDAAFRTWMRNSRKFGGKAKGNGNIVAGSFRKELPPEPARAPRTAEEQAAIDAKIAQLTKAKRI